MLQKFFFFCQTAAAGAAEPADVQLKLTMRRPRQWTLGKADNENTSTVNTASDFALSTLSLLSGGWQTPLPLPLYTTYYVVGVHGGSQPQPKTNWPVDNLPTVWLGRNLWEPSASIFFDGWTFFLLQIFLSVVESIKSDNCRNVYVCHGIFYCALSPVVVLGSLPRSNRLYADISSFNKYCFLKTYLNLKVLFLNLGCQNDLLTPFWHIPSLMPPDKSVEMGWNKSSN